MSPSENSSPEMAWQAAAASRLVRPNRNSGAFLIAVLSRRFFRCFAGFLVDRRYQAGLQAVSPED